MAELVFSTVLRNTLVIAGAQKERECSVEEWRIPWKDVVF